MNDSLIISTFASKFCGKDKLREDEKSDIQYRKIGHFVLKKAKNRKNEEKWSLEIERWQFSKTLFKLLRKIFDIPYTYRKTDRFDGAESCFLNAFCKHSLP
ncbi:MAG: hypothetical protein AAF705_20565 [Bacteroidota bacterium]